MCEKTVAEASPAMTDIAETSSVPEPTLGAYRFDNAEPASSTTASSSPKRPHRTAPESPWRSWPASVDPVDENPSEEREAQERDHPSRLETTPVLAVEAVREKTTNGSATSWHDRASMSAVEAPSHSP